LQNKTRQRKKYSKREKIILYHLEKKCLLFPGKPEGVNTFLEREKKSVISEHKRIAADVT